MDSDLDKIGMSEAEFERQCAEATRRGAKRLANAPKAAAVRFERQSKRLVIELKSGVVLMIPTELVQGLRDAPADRIEEVELWMEGMYLHWEKLDVDFEVSSLMRGVFGTRKWMEKLNLPYVKADDILQKKVA